MKAKIVLEIDNCGLCPFNIPNYLRGGSNCQKTGNYIDWYNINKIDPECPFKTED